MKFSEFITEHGIEVAECQYIGRDVEPKSSIRTYRYSMKLRRIGTTELYRVVSFGTGEGNVERWARETNASNAKTKAWGSAIKVGSKLVNSKTLAARAYLDAIAKSYQPDVESVLYCLAADAQTVHNARSFEEWANDLGYDADSRKAEKIYNACRDEAFELMRWLGGEHYQQLIECEE